MTKKMILRPVLGIIVICFFVVIAEIAVTDSNSIQENKVILLRQIRECIEKKHIPDKGVISQDTIAKYQEEFGKYKTLLEKLAVASVESDANIVSAPSEIYVESSLLAIAQNYHANPNLIDELITDYGSWKGDKNRQPVVLTPQSLKDKHAAEKYRLAWETLLLAPETPEIDFMSRRIFEALQRIDNPESVPALAGAVRLTTLKDVPQEAKIVNRQTEILAILAQWPEEKTLTAIFTCLEHVDQRCEGQAPTKTFDGYTLRRKAFRFIADPDNKGITKSEKRRLVRARKWKAVVNKYSMPVQSEKNKQMLEKLKSRTLPKVQN